MYNRERFIARAIRSCLNQDFEDFEIIVVDDGCTDKSAKIVRSFDDHRIEIVRLQTNQERLRARNAGGSIALGEWFIWFDSDDELLPNALGTMYKRARELSPDIKVMRFMCLLESGKLSPDPPHLDETWDYQGYIRWIESHFNRRSEALPVVHRATFGKVRFPEDKWYTGETQYHLDLAKHTRIRACPDVVRHYLLDADNNTWKPDASRIILAAECSAKRLEALLAEHGEALAEYAPRVFCQYTTSLVTQSWLAGNRIRGLRYAMKSFSDGCQPTTVAAVSLLGLLGPRPLAWAKSLQHRRKTRWVFDQ